MLAFNHHPQAALDAPRICIAADKIIDGKPVVYVEEGISVEAVEGLKKLGHQIEVLTGWKRGMFGRGQIIRCHYDEGTRVYSAGSDPRGDGLAIPLL
jgi:gamma-glutamyltranspeptidase/glutathione hydrolase